MDKANKDKLSAVKLKLDNLRGEIGLCLGTIQDLINAEDDEDVKDALQEAADALDEVDDKFTEIDSNLNTASE